MSNHPQKESWLGHLTHFKLWDPGRVVPVAGVYRRVPVHRRVRAARAGRPAVQSSARQAGHRRRRRRHPGRLPPQLRHVPPRPVRPRRAGDHTQRRRQRIVVGRLPRLGHERKRSHHDSAKRYLARRSVPD